MTDPIVSSAPDHGPVRQCPLCQAYAPAACEANHPKTCTSEVAKLRRQNEHLRQAVILLLPSDTKIPEDIPDFQDFLRRKIAADPNYGKGVAARTIDAINHWYAATDE